MQYKVQQSSVNLVAFGGKNTERGIEKRYLCFVKICGGIVIVVR